MRLVEGASGDERPATLFEMQPDPDAKIPMRSLPGLVKEGLKLVWHAGPREFTVSAVMQALSALGIFAQLLLARLVFQALFDGIHDRGSLAAIIPPATAVGAVTTGLLLASAVQRERQQILGERVMRYVEQKVLDVASAVELEMFESHAFHNRIQRVRMQAQQPVNLVIGLSGLASTATGVTGAVAALLALQPILLPMLLIILAPALLMASRRGKAFWWFGWRMTPRDRERQYIAGLLSGRDEAKEVRAFGTGPLLRRRYEQLYEARITELQDVARRQLAFALGANLVIGAALVGTILMVAWLTTSGRVTLGQAAIGVAGTALIGMRLTQAGYAAGSLAESALFINDYNIFLEMLPKAAAARPAGAAPSGFERLKFDRVTFTYPTAERPALLDVSLEVRAGEVVALVGENGSGKTTLAKLLARLYRPDQGTILWDGKDIATVDPEGLRRSIAIIFQDYMQYHLPARDNIGLGRPEAVDDLGAIRRAAEQAGADAFLTALPEGYETMLGPQFVGGTDLSCGQWQRVALARAFFRDAPFVILDEPTAALDARAEHELFERIRILLAGRTVLLISHRFSSVRSADRIYVLDDGRIVESGTHEELINEEGLYKELFVLQAAAYTEPQSSVPS